MPKFPEPKVVTREAQAYVAVARSVTIPFGAAVGEAMGTLYGAMGAQGIQEVEAPFFKYNLINMPHLEMEFGAPVAPGTRAAPPLTAGTLPAGRYVTLTYVGPYDDLIAVTGHLLDWTAAQGLALDRRPASEGEFFASRFEVYPNSPDKVPPHELITELYMKLRD